MSQTGPVGPFVITGGTVDGLVVLLFLGTFGALVDDLGVLANGLVVGNMHAKLSTQTYRSTRYMP